MSKDSIALEKAKIFAIKMVNLYKFLSNEKREFVLSKQLLQSGTSIGANLTEAIHGSSEKDFLAKIYIALKECGESSYWLELLYKTEYINSDQYSELDSDCVELIKLLKATAKTLSSKLKVIH